MGEIGQERCWSFAENETRQIISRFQPTLASDQRRRHVIAYITRLINYSTGCVVFPFGSFPLKTYLPDGDIDLTVFGSSNVEAAINRTVSELQEVQSNAADFVVRDIKLIRAEVMLVKCIVQNIVVDISFNQLGGLSTLCFIEQVDRFINKEHLFKRSLILIKAWCFYESRTLGAHHSLFSTYALEILVLYIINVFHSTLHGPLAVLYRFLDYFSKFDWENYCISIPRPILLSSLSNSEAETQKNRWHGLLLTEDFFNYCVATFSDPTKVGDSNSRNFPLKHLNILDPLKEFNNLGRSVTKGNSCRIINAFSRGAQKLRELLMLPEESIAIELYTFFSTTLDRNGSGQRPDVQDPPPLSSPRTIHPAFSVTENRYGQVEYIRFGSTTNNQEYIRNLEGQIDALVMELKRRANEHQRRSANFICSTMSSQDHAASSSRGRNAQEYHFSVDVQDQHKMHREVLSPNRPQDAISMAYAVALSRDSPTSRAASNVRHLENLNLFVDLKGDILYFLSCLRHGQRCMGYCCNIPELQMTPPTPRPHYFPMPYGPMNSMPVRGVSFGAVDGPKPRGLGTFFPRMNWPPRGYRSSEELQNRMPAWSSPRRHRQGNTFGNQGNWVPRHPGGHNPSNHPRKMRTTHARNEAIAPSKLLTKYV